MLQLSASCRAGVTLLGLGAVLGLAAPAARAQTNTPKYSNEFLNLGAGARSLGMGKTQVSLANDATAGYWNPAALTTITAKYDGVLMHSELFSGVVKNDYAAFAMPLDEKSAVGVTLLRLGVDNIADTRALVNEYGYIQYDKITYFSVADYALLLSYARKVGPEGLSVGGSGKFIYRNVGPYANAYGFGVDVGLQYNHKGWLLGLMARDITTTFNAWSIDADKFKANTIPGEAIPTNTTELTLPRLVLGAGRQFTLPAQFTALVAVDLEATTDGQRNTLISAKPVSVDPRVGVEIGYRNLAFLRGGVGNYQKITTFDMTQQWKGQYSLGAGVAFSGLRVDLALSRLAVEKLGSTSQTNSLIVSLGYGLGSRTGSVLNNK
ncbi:PorV/PorQ family protein [Siccationidurans ginsengisoli]|uniref:putative type IX sorting system protein PorV2 n=1 Tax=Hymenobacter TaxID=89966 RepID=UPI001AAD7F88|nr:MULTISPECIES: PorV/PorQ family protein [unclassified Hymenobacter]MBO2031698.1 PorV/PorQ family protein [Hymenobacter sp. BT559]